MRRDLRACGGVGWDGEGFWEWWAEGGGSWEEEENLLGGSPRNTVYYSKHNTQPVLITKHEEGGLDSAPHANEGLPRYSPSAVASTPRNRVARWPS